MKVKKESCRIVKPYYSSATPATETEVVPLSVFDTIQYNIHVAVVYAYRPPVPLTSVIEKGLAIALSEYREWAGQLDLRKNVVVLNDKGAKFVEASVDDVLDKSILFNPSTKLLSLHPSLYGAEELVQVQLTRFKCGSMVVGFTAHHYIADGNSTSNFLVAWGKATRGVSMEPLPLHGRSSFFVPRNPPKFEFEHRGVEFVPKKKDKAEDDDHHEHESPEEEVVIHKVNFSKEFLTKLKAKASTGGTRKYSTFESLQAHLWRRMTKARGLTGNKSIQIRISVNGRQRLQLPNEYFGNLVLWAFPRASIDDLLTKPLRFAAEVIHKEVAKVDESYFKSFIDFASSEEILKKENLVSSAVLSKSVLCPNMEVDSWLRFPFYELDFGEGSPFVFMPTYFPIEGMLFLLPSFDNDGSIDAIVPVFKKDLELFKTIACTLD